ncbi:hypothetical protein PSAC2689_70277 [Paraburkholderia sacchari]
MTQEQPRRQWHRKSAVKVSPRVATDGPANWRASSEIVTRHWPLLAVAAYEKRMTHDAWQLNLPGVCLGRSNRSGSNGTVWLGHREPRVDWGRCQLS